MSESEIYRFNDGEETIAIPLTEATREEATADGEDSLEATEAELGFEQESEGVWIKDYGEQT